METNDTINRFKNRDERALHRYEFLEIIVRLAQSKYKDPKIVPSLRDSLEKIIVDDILANHPISSQSNIYTEKVNEILSKNEAVLARLFDCHSKTKYITIEECTLMLNKAPLKVGNLK